MSSPADAPARSRGKIIEWNTAKGYGFVDDGHRRVFAHIRDFTERHKTPEPGDVLHYCVGDDGKGRVCARQIVPVNRGGRLRGSHLLALALLMATPAAAIFRLAAPGVGAWSAFWVCATSAISYGFYAWDKRRAQNDEWRLPENILRTWDLLGGWPGGFLAQRRLRHKCSKPSYQFVFWLIVVGHNFAALDWQLDWRLSRRAGAAVSSLVNLATEASSTPAQRPRVY